MHTVAPLDDPVDPPTAWSRWDSFGWTWLAASIAVYVGALLFRDVVPRFSSPVMSVVLLVGIFPAFIGMDVAAKDPVGFLSIALPAGLLAIVSFLVPRDAAFWLDLAAIGFVLSFWAGRPVVWRSWARIVLRRPPRSMKDRLRHAYRAVVAEINRTDLTDAEFARVRRDIERLDHYRIPETNEFIEVARSELMAWADRHADRRGISQTAVEERNRRITELANQLWPQDGPTRAK
jgi:hypothetical protein